jgi:hypothetical protein
MPACLLTWALTNFWPGLGWKHDYPDFCLPGSWDNKREPLYLTTALKRFESLILMLLHVPFLAYYLEIFYAYKYH